MPENLLILHPRDPWHAPKDRETVLRALADTGLTAPPVEDTVDARYRAGDRFLDHITFLGCSPVIALDAPGAAGEMCLVEVTEPFAEPGFLAGVNAKLPRCPACRYRVEGWEGVVEEWRQAGRGHRWRCPMCGQEYAAPELDWRQSAGFGRVFVRISGIFEGEAVPGEELLRALAEAAGAEFTYFYFRG
jgi:hypothetical protein